MEVDIDYFRMIDIETDSDSSFVERISDISIMSFDDTDYDTSDFDEEEYRAISLMSLRYQTSSPIEQYPPPPPQPPIKPPQSFYKITHFTQAHYINQLALVSANEDECPTMRQEFQMRVDELLNTVNMMLGPGYGDETGFYKDIKRDIGKVTPAFLEFLDNMSGKLQQIEIPADDTVESNSEIQNEDTFESNGEITGEIFHVDIKGNINENENPNGDTNENPNETTSDATNEQSPETSPEKWNTKCHYLFRFLLCTNIFLKDNCNLLLKFK